MNKANKTEKAVASQKSDKPVHKCKMHNYQHDYIVCVKCGHQFCGMYWAYCPSCQHPQHPEHSDAYTRGYADGYNEGHYDQEAKASGNFRLKLTAHMCDNVYYLSRANGHILLQSKSGIAHALSNICRDAALFEFALEDANTAAEALAAVRKHATYIKHSEVI